ncbi:MAG TPA: OmpA family protein [Polyangiaceae bacterium]
MKALILASPVLVALAMGCATSKPSAQLMNARSAYQRASESEATKVAPARVAAARQALDKAERAYRDDPGSFEEKSLAYIAQRKAELAQAYADLEMAERTQASAEALYQQRQVEMRANAQRSLEETTTELESARRELAVQGQARAEAEQRLTEALRNMEANVKQDATGTVITLGGAVLFETGKSRLMPMAERRLDKISGPLANIDPSQTIVVEGHTDSQGDEQMNMRLSQDRADQVRDRLIEQGVPAAQIRAIGRGEDEPIASNDTAAGRTINRRVEILVQWPEQAGSPAPGAEPMQAPPMQAPSRP